MLFHLLTQKLLPTMFKDCTKKSYLTVALLLYNQLDKRLVKMVKSVLVLMCYLIFRIMTSHG